MPSIPIPPEPTPATSLDDILASPGQWFLLASRGWAGPGEQLPPWDYCLGGGGMGEGNYIHAARERLWELVQARKLFAPQRRLESRLEWLAIALPRLVGPPGARRVAAEASGS